MLLILLMLPGGVIAQMVGSNETSFPSGTNITQTNSNFSNVSTVYWWSVNLSDGQGGWNNETYHFTTEAENVTVNATPATWSQGDLNLGTTNETTGNHFTLTNEGNVAVNISINASNATNGAEEVKWLLDATPGHDQFTFQYNKSTDPSWTTINTSFDTFTTNLPYSGINFKLFDLKILMATTSSTSDPLTVTLPAITLTITVSVSSNI